MLGETSITGLTIRPMTLGDLGAIVEIDRKVLGQTRRDYWKKKIEFPNDRYPLSSLVSELEGKVVGFIVGEVSGWEFGIPDTVGWISTIGVDPEYQHRGIARKLGEEYIKNLKSLGIGIVYTLVSWNDWDLLSFFHSMGFSRGGEMINLELKLDRRD